MKNKLEERVEELENRIAALEVRVPERLTIEIPAVSICLTEYEAESLQRRIMKHLLSDRKELSFENL